MAESLGLHKIDKAIVASPTDQQHHNDMQSEMVQKEVGKRVWCQMVVQDHFAIPFTDSYGIKPAQYLTELPMNADDDHLVALPDSVPSISTYTRVLATIARLMPELADGLGPLTNRKPVHEQYKHVLHMDQKMRQLVHNIPTFLLRKDQEQEGWLPWLGIARQSLAITAAEKIIMIHRPFIFRSFQSSVFAHTRRTCVSAALTILREHENIVQAGELSLWTHTAFCITAAVILCFEIKNTSSSPNDRSSPATIAGQVRIEGSDAQTLSSHYRDRIQAARNRLADRKHDILARRGILLIKAILPEIDDDHHHHDGVDFSSEQWSSPAHQTDNKNNKVNFKDIVSRFVTEYSSSSPGLELEGANPPPQQRHRNEDRNRDVPILVPEEQQPMEPFGSEDLAGMFTDDDFEAWFTEVFVSSTTPLDLNTSNI
ncbi:hypothetical protein A1O3_04879 [Capronia epimyces CBS 606.96]|uniref:Transcription factor domain-containing protein n=1 Tax=Capronia epimyces CBS 606.96 TaxID=1182542 RepID=W9XUF9_9EURO|nr:uncharacterized protein A1O3_04879 [Capronia epimyces CBS 606.96]EXJ84212.1 hypothetical protein A1O3_04879 [Capronia epimyces CBS 606.96]